MANRISGKYGKIMISTTKTEVSSESATLNSSSETIGGISYAAYRVATLANQFVLPDSIEAPLTITVAAGSGSPIPADLSYIVDYILGKIIFSTALTSGNTVTVSYSYASGLVEVADMTEWSIDEKVDEIETTSFNDEWKTYVAAQKSWDASLSGHFNLYLWREAVGNDDGASYSVPAPMVYAKFYINRQSAVSATNPYWCGCGLMSTSIKTGASAKVEFSAKIKGIGGLGQMVA